MRGFGTPSTSAWLSVQHVTTHPILDYPELLPIHGIQSEPLHSYPTTLYVSTNPVYPAYVA